jgi:hypothetical protein
MDLDKAAYIARHYSDLFSPTERLAYRRLFLTEKITHGRSDAAAQAEAANHPRHRHEFADDPEILRLAALGYQGFIIKTAERIMAIDGHRMFFNCCSRCGRLARTPKARQCRFCFHDWHSA